jgi:alpha-L-fucosidase
MTSKGKTMPEDVDRTSKARAEILRRVEEGIQAGPFRADWDSIVAGYSVPTWYSDAKFGIFIHWGPYCVPGFSSEWYPREMYRAGRPEFEHHRSTYGRHDQFGYKDFIPSLTGSGFDPADWASLFRRAGAQFVVPVGEHHDGFPMYASELTRWNAAAMGPGRDVVKELSDAVRAQSMIPGASSHRAEHWWFFNGGMRFDSDVRDPEYADLYGPAQREEITPTEAFLEDWLARTVEMVEHNDAQLIWFDWWIEQDVFQPWLAKFAAWYYNRAVARNRPVAINYKFDPFPPGSAVYDVERGQNAGIRPMLWQNDTSVAVRSWGWIEGQEYKDIRDILGDLLDVVSKNGALLLNVGPKPDGTFEPEERDLLCRIGDWLAVNGEAIYGTTPFSVSGEGPTEVEDTFLNDEHRSSFTAKDIRFTTRYDLVYATPLDWPEGDTLLVRTLADGSPHFPGPIGSVELLGNPSPLTFERSADGLLVHLPSERGSSPLPVLRITPALRSPQARKHQLRN